MKLSPSARQMEWKRFMEALSPDYTVNKIEDPQAHLMAEEEEWARSHQNCLRSMMVLALPCGAVTALVIYGIWRLIR